MNIACIGWGSLIWQPKNLKIEKQWFKDGPMLPIEFNRKSDKGKGRITLIIDSFAQPVQTLWNRMTIDTLQNAVESLRSREKTSIGNINSITTTDRCENYVKATIQEWLISKKLDAAIWTALSYSEKNQRLNIEDVIEHLSNLNQEAQNLAEEYIRRAPRQINTEYRKKIEKAFGWFPID